LSVNIVAENASSLVNEPFAVRLARLRQDAELTQSALAAPRYTVSYVSQMESGKRTPSTEALGYLAGRLGVSPTYLETGIPDDAEQRLAYRIEEGRAAMRLGDLVRAEDAARSVVEEAARYGIDLVRARAQVLLGDVLLVAGRTREAIDRPTRPSSP
jgi:transcriptional regulator with XRE-family HTH domain